MHNLFIKRDILKELKNHLVKKEITLLVGPRQVGKTTIMNYLRNGPEKENQKTLFLDLDFENDKKHLISQETLLTKIKLEFGAKKGFIFMDEIQRKENAGIFLKGIYDQNLPHKFIVSGSGSLELKEKIHESLMGRKAVFEILPISFFEFVNFKTNYKYENQLERTLKYEVRHSYKS